VSAWVEFKIIRTDISRCAVQTRRFYACRSISKVKARFDCIVVVPAVISDSSDGEAACEAKRPLEKIESASFVLTLHIM